MYKILLNFLIALMLLSSSVISATEKISPDSADNINSTNNLLTIQKKDPLFAGVLSWYMPGMGQLYSDEILKGSIFMISEYSILIGSLVYFLDFDFSMSGDLGFGINVDARRTDIGLIETSRKNLFIGMISVLVLIHLYDVSDAVASAKNYNLKLDYKRQQIPEKLSNISFNYSNEKLNIQYCYRF